MQRMPGVLSFSEPKHAVALISVLWVIAIMGILTLLMSRQANLSLKINRNVMNSTKAYLLAEAGVYHAIGELVQDADTTTYDGRDEDWFDTPSKFMDIELGEGVYRLVHPDPDRVDTVYYGIMDESAKLNINVAMKEQLMQLEMMEEEIADAILDWRDEDDEPNPMGAESGYYNGLEEPYNAKNGLFDSLEELLLVKGVTVDLLYGEDTNLNGRLDTHENDGVDGFPNDNADGKLRRGWYPFLTVYSYEENVDGNGETRVNLNEADEEELENTLGEVLEENEIQSIIAARDQNNFESVGDLLDVQLTARSGGNNASGTLEREKVKQIIDRVTISNEESLPGRINLNTVSKTVLTYLLPENPEIVEAVLAFRQDGEGPFESIGNLLDVEGMTDDLFQQLVALVGTKSSVFSVRSIGYLEDSNAYKEVYAVIDRGVDPPEIRYWKVVR